MGGLPKQKPFSRLLYFNEISSSSLFSLSIQTLLHWDFNTFQTIFCALPYIHIQNLYTNNSGCLRAELRFSAFDIIIAHRIISNAQLFYWINVATNITSYIFEHLSFCKILCW